ncbi:MAG: carboxymuconolactone decarboxylase family protein [Alphaproteobacteria bacterium]|nr:carboxymuconolactone decarboxylase family protein [Alphaproteobacteria bacterium]
MSRLAALDPENMTSAQKKAHDGIASGPRGSVRGPFAALLHNPGVADAVQRMGAALRFDGTLPDNLREIAILVTGRFWTAQYEWWAHARIALEAGVDEAIVNAMAQRRRPSFVKSDEAAVYEFCTELHEKQSVSDENYAWVVEQLGEAGAVELIALCGYYTIISMTLNVAQTEIPDGIEPPLRP